MKYLITAVFAIIIVLHCIAQQPINKILKDSIINRRDDSLIADLKQNQIADIPIVMMDESDLKDNTSPDIQPILTASNDPFLSQFSFQFSEIYFRMRGYSSDNNSMYLNGLLMQQVDNGYTALSSWSGLYSVLQYKQQNIAANAADFSFGGIGVTSNLDARSYNKKRQTTIRYAISNRNFSNGFFLSHFSGINKKGWSFSVALQYRSANEGYVPGTYFYGGNYFLGISKRISSKYTLSVSMMGSSSIKTKQSMVLPEMDSLSGTHYYNSFWGYQNGVKRNANVLYTQQPTVIVTQDFRFNNHNNLTVAAGVIYTIQSSTALDWFNAPTPYPDYYKYLPSYQTNIAQKLLIQQLIINDDRYRQINWLKLYDANNASIETINNANGILGNSVTGKRSHYILAENHFNKLQFAATATYNSLIAKRIKLSAGATFQQQTNYNYRTVKDLLGGKFWVDWNQFAQNVVANNTAVQNDVAVPNKIVQQGEKYGWNYNINFQYLQGWLQTVITGKHIDFFVASQISNTKYYRTGNVRNGLFVDNSFGKSAIQNFINYAAKTGITFKINGRNFIYLNSIYLTKAPFYDNVFISPRTRNSIQDTISSELIQSAETGYILNSKKIRLRLSGYFTQKKNAIDVLSYYDDDLHNFVNYALTNISTTHFGGELGFEIKLNNHFRLTGAAALGDYFYSDRQYATITADNTASVLAKDIVYTNNYKIASVPQEAYSVGFQYRTKKAFVGVNGNYFNRLWMGFNPVRRTYRAVQDIAKNSQQWNNILLQQQLPAQYFLNAIAGYTIDLSPITSKRNSFIAINTSVNNILNNQQIITGAYEQLRFDFTNQNPNTFPAKYQYAYGTTYSCSIALHF